jgi:hypothetical protein
MVQLPATFSMSHRPQVRCITVSAPAVAKPIDQLEVALRFPLASGDVEFAGRSFIRDCAKAFDSR